MIEASMLEELTTQAANDGVQQLVVGALVQGGGKILLLTWSADDFMRGCELLSGEVFQVLRDCTRYDTRYDQCLRCVACGIRFGEVEADTASSSGAATLLF